MLAPSTQPITLNSFTCGGLSAQGPSRRPRRGCAERANGSVVTTRPGSALVAAARAAE